MTRIGVLLWMVAVAMGAPAGADEGEAAAAQPAARPKGCGAPEHRQFDFWVGNWNVANPQGSPVGTNLITLEHDGCVLQERWTGSRGGTGSSLNIYDATDGRWHQTWVDNRGGLLQLQGGIVDGRMILEGPSRGAKGEALTNRVVLEKLADGRVRQVWTTSADSGSTWTTVFDGYYTSTRDSRERRR